MSRAELTQDVATAALMAAVAKGVIVRDGYYEFEDPGLSLMTQRDLPIVRENNLIFMQEWYDGYEWAKQEDTPQMRRLWIPVQRSFNKSFADQETLLRPEEEVAAARVVTTFLVINALAMGTRLLPDCYFRCSDKYSGGYRVYVSGIGASGLDVDRGVFDDRSDPNWGVAASRKF